MINEAKEVSKKNETYYDSYYSERSSKINIYRKF